MWALAVDEHFQTIYSGGRDRRVYATELNQGTMSFTVLYSAVLYCTVVYGTLYCTVLYCTVLYCTLL